MAKDLLSEEYTDSREADRRKLFPAQDDPNPDTGLLASMLHKAYLDATDEGLSINDTWYRVAERAKELRA